jgi:hypothetical protein
MASPGFRICLCREGAAFAKGRFFFQKRPFAFFGEYGEVVFINGFVAI